MIRIPQSRSAQAASTPRRLSRPALAAVLTVGLAVLAMSVVSAMPRPRPAVARAADHTKYVAIPHPSNTEAKRKGAYIARSRRLPLIAEPGVTDVVIKEFGR